MKLGIDTTTSVGQIIISDSINDFHKIIWNKESNHSDVVTQKLEELLLKTGCEIKNIKEIFCFNGPGSFTGIRVTLSVVKSIAYAENIPLFCQNTLWGLALNALKTKCQNGLCLIDAQRGDVFALPFEVKNQSLLIKNSFPRLISPAQLELETSGDFDLWTVGYNNFSNSFSEKWKKNILNIYDGAMPALEDWLRLSYQKDFQVKSQSWKHLKPNYLRASSAEEKLTTTKV